MSLPVTAVPLAQAAQELLYGSTGQRCHALDYLSGWLRGCLRLGVDFADTKSATDRIAMFAIVEAVAAGLLTNKAQAILEAPR